MNKIICFLLVVMFSLKMQDEVSAEIQNVEDLQQNDGEYNLALANNRNIYLEMNLYLKNQQISEFINKYYNNNRKRGNERISLIYGCNDAKVELLKSLYSIYITFGFCDEFKQILRIITSEVSIFSGQQISRFFEWGFTRAYDPIEWVSDVDKKYEFVREIFLKDSLYVFYISELSDCLDDISMYHCILSSMTPYHGEIPIFNDLVSDHFLRNSGNRSEVFYNNLLDFFVNAGKIHSIEKICNGTLIHEQNSKSLKWLDKNLRILYDIDGAIFDKLKIFQEFLEYLNQELELKDSSQLELRILLKKYRYIDDKNEITGKFNLDFLSSLCIGICDGDKKKKCFKNAYEFRCELQTLCKYWPCGTYIVRNFCRDLIECLSYRPSVVCYYGNIEKLSRIKEYVNLYKDSDSIDRNRFYDNVVYIIATIPDKDIVLKIDFVRFLAVTFDIEICDILNDKLFILLENSKDKKDSNSLIGSNTDCNELPIVSSQYTQQNGNTDTFYKIMFNGMGEQNTDFSIFIRDKLLSELQKHNKKCDKFDKFLEAYLSVQEHWFYRRRGGKKKELFI